MYFQAILNLYWNELEIIRHYKASHKLFIALQYAIPLFPKMWIQNRIRSGNKFFFISDKSISEETDGFLSLSSL